MHSRLGALLLLITTLGCGRIGFDPLEGGTQVTSDGGGTPDGQSSRDASTVPDNAYFISPNGNDSDDGTQEFPFRSFSVALSHLKPGSVLLAMPGNYSISSGTGTLNIDCQSDSVACDGQVCPEGTASQPIVIRALEERKAHLSGELGMSDNLIRVKGCGHYKIEGFLVSNIDDASGPWPNVYINDSENIELRKNMVRVSNRMVNGHLLEISNSTDILIEDNEFYDFHRDAILVYQARAVEVRGNYANARNFADVAGGYESQSPTSGDTAFACSHSADCLFENNVSEGRTQNGFLLQAKVISTPAIARSGDNAKFLGNISMSPLKFGFYGKSNCEGVADCPEEAKVDQLLLQNNLFLNLPGYNHHNVFVRGVQGLLFEHNTSLNGSVRIDLSSDNSLLSSTVILSDSLSVPSVGVSFTVLEQASWAIDYSNGFGTSNTFDTGGNITGLGTHNTSIDPLLGSCLHRIPDASPMSGAGSGNSDIGANIIYRYKKGLLTDEPLWHPSTGAFPCGAIIAGVNDSGEVCSSVHTRLGVGSLCPVQ